jgi:phosphotransferase system HPr (HPr) family protein
MPERALVVTDEVGLHARPAALFVKEAGRFESDIRVRYHDRTVNAKSILEVLKLGAEQGAELLVVAEGSDAVEALDALEAHLAGRD